MPAKAADLTFAVGGAFTSMDPHFFDLSPNHALRRLYHQAIRIGFQRDLAVIPLHHQVNIWAMRRGITYTPQLSEQTRAMEFRPAP
jgi:hypothetical protein